MTNVIHYDKWSLSGESNWAILFSLQDLKSTTSCSPFTKAARGNSYLKTRWMLVFQGAKQKQTYYDLKSIFCRNMLAEGGGAGEGLLFGLCQQLLTLCVSFNLLSLFFIWVIHFSSTSCCAQNLIHFFCYFPFHITLSINVFLFLPSKLTWST